jgi:NADH-quinone oxidoreductase subunit G
MPKISIDGREVEVAAGTNLVEAGLKIGVQIPHYCYHPRLSVVGQCRMCMVEIEGMPKLQAACSTPVVKDGMVVRTASPAAVEAQRAIMEFLLINHPLDCPICDQAGECGLQDYSFKHGQAFSRFRFEDKRIYPEKERIPLGPHVLLNMNRCIQCTRCVRFTQEVSKSGELGFFARGAHAEIGTFPGKALDGPLSANVVDICPVGALTSTEFRFAERVWYLDKKPSLCTGCDVGCNITIEHRRGAIRRYKPRFNAEVNDYWMCDYGRGTFARYEHIQRLRGPRVRREAEPAPASWDDALDLVATRLRAAASGSAAMLGTGFLSTEEAFLLRVLADRLESPHRGVVAAPGPVRAIPRPHGWIRGDEAAPNRRGCELAGLVPLEGGLGAAELLDGDGAARCDVLLIAGGDLGARADDAAAVVRLRAAKFLVVLDWADSALARAADVALPTATHAERSGTFVNVEGRLQRFDRAFAPKGETRPAAEALLALLGRLDREYRSVTATAQAFARMAAAVPALHGLEFDRLPPSGVAIGATAAPGAASAAGPTASARGAGA